MNSLIAKNGLVVSCQALSHEPLHGCQHMVAMARAAKEGGAIGIRANSPEDIAAIRSEVDLPIIGLWKKDYDGFDVYITPTVEDAVAVYEAGASIVAIDATNRARPDGVDLQQTIAVLKNMGIPVMADISTYEEGLMAAEWGADYISTTLSGYTPYSLTRLPNLELVSRLSQVLTVPTVAEGGISTPEEAGEALQSGAHFVVVGSAITRPQLITAQYVSALQDAK
ncbi:N-acetylmannosamine-6-phosphate 2-epimerase [Paenibacillus sp. FA6]|uniref:N-acetylmannosamine-6-phosphate 2-epimerase n=1 Tax=Paenibacillus sp. FA6 TaxID=3413029 RepID=UPI003F657158